MSKDSTNTETAYINESSDIEQYKDLKEYLSHELTHHEFTNLYRTLGFNHRQKLARLINGHTPWEFNKFLELIEIIGTGIAPSKIIKHFNINHDFTDYEFTAVDAALTGVRPTN